MNKTQNHERIHKFHPEIGRSGSNKDEIKLTFVRFELRHTVRQNRPTLSLLVDLPLSAPPHGRRTPVTTTPHRRRCSSLSPAVCSSPAPPLLADVEDVGNEGGGNENGNRRKEGKKKIKGEREKERKEK
ncbi:hypothetical protein Dimus_038609 [Dionaea muscipula]